MMNRYNSKGMTDKGFKVYQVVLLIVLVVIAVIYSVGS